MQELFVQHAPAFGTKIRILELAVQTEILQQQVSTSTFQDPHIFSHMNETAKFIFVTNTFVCEYPQFLADFHRFSVGSHYRDLLAAAVHHKLSSSSKTRILHFPSPKRKKGESSLQILMLQFRKQGSYRFLFFQSFYALLEHLVYESGGFLFHQLAEQDHILICMFMYIYHSHFIHRTVTLEPQNPNTRARFVDFCA